MLGVGVGHGVGGGGHHGGGHHGGGHHGGGHHGGGWYGGGPWYGGYGYYGPAYEVPAPTWCVRVDRPRQAPFFVPETYGSFAAASAAASMLRGTYPGAALTPMSCGGGTAGLGQTAADAGFSSGMAWLVGLGLLGATLGGVALLAR